MLKRTLSAIAASVLASALLGVPAAPAAAFPVPVVPEHGADYNGDGYEDVVTSEPRRSVSGLAEAGAIRVVYGSSTGLTTAGNQMITQATAGVPGSPAERGHFGDSIATGNFNGDQYADLAVGTYNTIPDSTALSDVAGSVTILYGSSAGLHGTATAQGMAWRINAAAVVDDEDNETGFGLYLTTGYFDGDSYADLAIGYTSYESVHGGVAVLFGASSGLSLTGQETWTNTTPGIPGGIAEYPESFPSELASGDFNDDSYDDLVIGLAGPGLPVGPNVGAVIVLRGSAGGLTTAGGQWWDQESPGMPSASNGGDIFGGEFAVGDIDNDGYEDLAIAAKGEDDGAWNSGAVTVLYGGSGGLSTSGVEYWHQDVAGVPDTGEDLDHLGEALAIGDFTGDGYDDLAMSVSEDVALRVGTIEDAGAFIVLPGTGSGLTSTGSAIWHQNSGFVEDTAEAYDNFGWDLLAVDVNNDPYVDLVSGIPGEDVGAVTNAGALSVMFGSAGALTATGNQYLVANALASGGATNGYCGTGLSGVGTSSDNYIWIWG